jgi:hypothetical protein
VVDERAGIGAADPVDPVEGTSQNGAGVLRRNVSAREHKRAYFGCLQRKAFELAVAYALVASQNDPAVPSGFREPNVIGDASGEAFGVSFHGCARVAQRGYDGEAVQRLVEKEGERFRRL